MSIQATSNGRAVAATALTISILASVVLGFAGYALVEMAGGLASKLGRLVMNLAPLPIVMSLSALVPAQAGQRPLSAGLAQLVEPFRRALHRPAP